jgi:uncharacterized membrane protein SpoIIM required for sporulation
MEAFINPTTLILGIFFVGLPICGLIFLGGYMAGSLRGYREGYEKGKEDERLNWRLDTWCK